jgi:hypothetical protein
MYLNKTYSKFRIFFPVVMYGPETRSIALRDEYRLGVFDSRVLSGIFGPKR